MTSWPGCGLCSWMVSQRGRFLLLELRYTCLIWGLETLSLRPLTSSPGPSPARGLGQEAPSAWRPRETSFSFWS